MNKRPKGSLPLDNPSGVEAESTPIFLALSNTFCILWVMSVSSKGDLSQSSGNILFNKTVYTSPSFKSSPKFSISLGCPAAFKCLLTQRFKKSSTGPLAKSSLVSPSFIKSSVSGWFLIHSGLAIILSKISPIISWSFFFLPFNISPGFNLFGRFNFSPTSNTFLTFWVLSSSDNSSPVFISSSFNKFLSTKCSIFARTTPSFNFSKTSSSLSGSIGILFLVSSSSQTNNRFKGPFPLEISRGSILVSAPYFFASSITFWARSSKFSLSKADLSHISGAKSFKRIVYFSESFKSSEKFVTSFGYSAFCKC